jgi:uncharacterized membrane protein YgdD (TMEM256/DUF423 family)
MVIEKIDLVCMWARFEFLVDFFESKRRFAGSLQRYVCKVHILNKENESWVALGLAAVAFSIALAAYGRHALTDPDLQIRWSIAVEYLRYMGLGLLVMTLMRNAWLSNSCRPWPERLLVFGIVLFSGVLMLESLEPEWVERGPLRMAPPIGGISLIISWLWFLRQFLRRSKPAEDEI